MCIGGQRFMELRNASDYTNYLMKVNSVNALLSGLLELSATIKSGGLFYKLELIRRVTNDYLTSRYQEVLLNTTAIKSLFYWTKGSFDVVLGVAKLISSGPAGLGDVQNLARVINGAKTVVSELPSIVRLDVQSLLQSYVEVLGIQSDIEHYIAQCQIYSANDSEYAITRLIIASKYSLLGLLMQECLIKIDKQPMSLGLKTSKINTKGGSMNYRSPVDPECLSEAAELYLQLGSKDQVESKLSRLLSVDTDVSLMAYSILKRKYDRAVALNIWSIVKTNDISISPLDFENSEFKQRLSEIGSLHLYDGASVPSSANAVFFFLPSLASLVELYTRSKEEGGGLLGVQTDKGFVFIGSDAVEELRNTTFDRRADEDIILMYRAGNDLVYKHGLMVNNMNIALFRLYLNAVLEKSINGPLLGISKEADQARTIVNNFKGYDPIGAGNLTLDIHQALPHSPRSFDKKDFVKKGIIRIGDFVGFALSSIIKLNLAKIIGAVDFAIDRSSIIDSDGAITGVNVLSSYQAKALPKLDAAMEVLKRLHPQDPNIELDDHLGSETSYKSFVKAKVVSTLNNVNYGVYYD